MFVRPSICVLLAALLSVALGATRAETINYTTIADNTTPNPGGFPSGNGPGTLQNLWTWAVIDGDTVYFQADVNLPTGSSDGGFFSGSGGPITFYADVFSSVPDGTGTFSGISNQIAATDGVLFFDGRDQTNTRGLYRADDMLITELYDDTDPIPGGGQFSNFAAGDYQNGVLAFYADNGLTGAIYHWDNGTLIVIANTSTPKPQGGGNFQNISSQGISIDQGVTSFIGTDGSGQGDGIYLYDTALSNLVQRGDLTPIAPRAYDRFFNASYRDGQLAFTANDDLGQPAVYLFNGSSFEVIADLQTPAPGSGQLFTAFNGVATANGRVLFQASRVDARRGGGTVQGVFLWSQGQLQSIYEGSSRVWNRSMDGNQFVYGQPNAYVRGSIVLDTDLTIKPRACAEVVKVGDTLRYEIQIDNLGPEDASGLMLDLQVGPEAQFVDSQPPGQCSDIAGAVSCDLGNLAASGQLIVGIDVSIVSAGVGSLQTTFAVSSNENDLVMGKNLGSETTRIQPDLIFASSFRSCRI